MFPGYIFLKIDMNQYSSLKYTKGIKKILKFGNTIPTINQDDIDAIMQVENESKKTPISFKYSIGQEVIIKDGSFKGNLAKICKLPSNKRVDILIYILGSQRKVNVSLRDIQN